MTIQERLAAKKELRQRIIDQHANLTQLYQNTANSMNDLTRQLIGVEGAIAELEDMEESCPP